MTQQKNARTKGNATWLQSLAGAAIAAAVVLLVATIAGFLLWAFLR